MVKYRRMVNSYNIERFCFNKSTSVLLHSTSSIQRTNIQTVFLSISILIFTVVTNVAWLSNSAKGDRSNFGTKNSSLLPHSNLKAVLDSPQFHLPNSTQVNLLVNARKVSHFDLKI